MNNSENILELIKSDNMPYLVTRVKGINNDFVTEYFYSGKVIIKKLPGTFSYLKFPVLMPIY